MSSTSILKESCISILKSVYGHDIGFPVLPSVISTQSIDSQLTSNEAQLLSLYDKLSSLTIEAKILEVEIATLESNGMMIILVLLLLFFFVGAVFLSYTVYGMEC